MKTCKICPNYSDKPSPITDIPNMTINLSNTKLNTHQTQTLNKGLSFTPTPTKHSTLKSLNLSTSDFFNKMSKIYFISTQIKLKPKLIQLKRKTFGWHQTQKTQN